MKQFIKFHLNILAIAVVFFASTVSVLNAQSNESGEKGHSLQLLIEGNKRFVSGSFGKKDFAKERAELVNGQQPYAIILSCSDSRVPPELIFDESLGRLFIIRVAGNVIDPVTLGSIEYAAEHLHTKLLVVLGHESCGAVKASIAGGEFTPNIAQIVKQIEPSVKRAIAKKVEKQANLDFVIADNVKSQISASITNSKVIKEMVEGNELQIVGAVYSLKTGSVTWLPSEKEKE